MAAKRTARHFGARWRLFVAAGATGLVVVLLAFAIPAARTHNADSVAASGPTGASGVAASLSVTAITPDPGAINVSYATSIDINFSTALSPNTPLPTITPPVSGTWTRPRPDSLEFLTAGSLVPHEGYTVSIPAGADGPVGQNGATLTTAFSSKFTVGGAPTERLAQLLAELDYLPVAVIPAGSEPPVPSSSTTTTAPATTTTSSTVPATTQAPATTAAPTTSSTSTTTTTVPPTSQPATDTSALESTNAILDAANANEAALDAEPDVAAAIPLSVQPGTFAWRFPSIPSQLSALWTPDSFTVILQGAVMAFENIHDLAVNGVSNATFWSALLDAVASRQVTTQPYDYLLVTETLPESLFVWRDGSVIYSSRANTGVPGAATPLGNWPVYAKFTSTTMTGTNPDGSHYSDPGVPWVSYFYEGDAVHGFVRASYGFPQSDGCVELPIANAETVFPLDPYGTIVTVTTGDLASELGVDAPPPVY